MTPKIFIIGSEKYRTKMRDFANICQRAGYMVRLPAFDSDAPDEIGICTQNLEGIKWADEVHIFWDNRSIGTIFDFGMCFALGKKVIIGYIETKTFEKLIRKYEIIKMQKEL